MAIKTFTTGEVLTAADTNTYLANSGLVYIGTTALSGVTTNISNVFSSTYDNYRVTIHNLNNSTANTRVCSLRFRTTSDDTTASYFYMQYGFYNVTAFNSGAGGQTSAQLLSISNSGNNGGSVTFDICSPNLTHTTSYGGSAVAYQTNVSAHTIRTIGGGAATTTQYTGFSIIGDTDSLSGTVTCYGYRKA